MATYFCFKYPSHKFGFNEFINIFYIILLVSLDKYITIFTLKTELDDKFTMARAFLIEKNLLYKNLRAF